MRDGIIQKTIRWRPNVDWGIPGNAAAELHAAEAVSIDLETTGLTPASARVPVSRSELLAGANPQVRARVLSVAYIPEGGCVEDIRSFAVDLDFADDREVIDLLNPLRRRNVFGYNIGFDLYWIRHQYDVSFKHPIDLMTLARWEHPLLPVELAKASRKPREGEPEHPHRRYFWELFRKESGFWTLDTLVRFFFGKALNKDMQGPRNWIVPTLTEEHRQYAVEDAVWTLRLAFELLGDRVDERIRDLRESRGERFVALLESPKHLTAIRRRGIPFDKDAYQRYIDAAQKRLKESAAKVIEIHPKMAEFESDLLDWGAGISDKMKLVIAQYFEDRGVRVQYSKKAGSPKIGTKDLQAVGARRNEATAPFFEAWAEYNKAKKTGKMAMEYAGFAFRSKDGRIHPLLGPGPITGRLSSAEPNSQQLPGEQAFRDIVGASPGCLMASVDYSALDMRVGAALAVRAQKEILRLRKGEDFFGSDRIPGKLRTKLLRVVRRVYDEEVSPRHIRSRWLTLIEEREKARRAGDWKRRDELEEMILLSKFGYFLACVRDEAKRRGQETFSALAEAFSLGVDIHTFTTLKMQGERPEEMYRGLSRDEVAGLNERLKKKLGSRRKRGKVANLALLYDMSPRGYQHYAAANHDMHLAEEEAERDVWDWQNSYPEIPLWAAWTHLTKRVGVYWVPSEDSPYERPRTFYLVETLDGRPLCAQGEHAALNYGDQGTGADILDLVLHRLHRQHEDVFDCIVNQIHDELLAEFPADKAKEMADLLSSTMVEVADLYLRKHDVSAAADPEIGKTWLKG